MIEFQCSCGQAYRVGDDKAGVKAKCKKCGEVMTVPATAASQVELELEPAGPTAHVASPRASSALAGVAAAPSRSQQNRIAHAKGYPFSPDEELDRRKRNIIMLGVMLLIGFICPMVAPGAGMIVPGIAAMTDSGTSILGKLDALFPLVAGIIVLIAASVGTMASRSWTLVALGLAHILITVMNISESGLFNMLPSNVLNIGVIMVILFFVSTWGIVAGARARWYRPETQAAYPIGAVGGVALILLLVIPLERIPIIAVPFMVLTQDFSSGIGLLIAMGLWIAAGIACLANTPTRPGPAASKLAKTALDCLRGTLGVFLGVMIIIFFIGGMGRGGGAVLVMGLLGLIRGLSLFLGIILLLPSGVVDLLIGVPRVNPYECTGCGYDLRGSPSGACPECGQVNTLPV